jgi:branched-chain amino acid transport system ATP-binding protein
MTLILEIHDLCKRFDGLSVTDHVNLDIKTNEIHALIGPNGAGKTTLLAQLSGTLPMDSGNILLKGKDISRLSAHRRVTHGLARSFQLTSVFNELSVRDNIVLAIQARTGSSFKFWRQIETEADLFSAANDLLEQIGLASRSQTRAMDLAHGEQRQLEIALALATQPKVLLLDEPMAGMGFEDSARMVEFIQSLKGKLTILLVEHDMDAVFRLADRISVLVSGRIIATGTPSEVRNHAEVRHAYLGDVPREVGRA